MAKAPWLVIYLAVIALLAGCVGLRSHYEPPTVNVSSFRVLPMEGTGQQFEIGLHVINPNRSSLNLYGIAYWVEIEGHRILTGVASDLPEIKGYGEGEVLLTAKADLFNSINFIAGLFKDKRDTLIYRLHAKLDLGLFQPEIHVDKKGEISLPRPK